MKSTFKKVMALLLCLMVFLPLVTIQAFAAETSDTSGAATSGTTSAGNDESGDEDVWKKLKPAYMSTGFTSVDDRINGNDVIAPMTCMLIKDGYAIYADSLTGEVVLLKLSKPNDKNEYEKKDNGVYKYDGYFTTNPYNIGSATVAGKAVSEIVKEPLYSQVELTYMSNETETTLNSFKDAAINDQINIKEIRNGIRVEYTLGREEIKYLVPRRIKKDKLDAIAAQILANSAESRDSRQFMSFYLLKDPNANEPKKSIETMKKEFPICTKFPIYVCEPAITARELIRLENMIKKYTNYSFDQLDIDHAETEYVAADKAPPLFKLALEYTIDEFGFAVRCNAGNIRFDTEAYKLSDITVLPFAGAGDTSKKGYILTPDGSGTLFRFEDVKSQPFTTANQLYGPDYAFHTITGANKQNMYFPVFGVVQSYKDFDEEDTAETEVPTTEVSGDTSENTENTEASSETSEVTAPANKVENINTGYFAVIEDGESLANITVNNGGTTHSYISVHTTFNPRPKDKYELTGGISASANTTWTVESKRKYTGDLKLRFFILTDDVSYSGMAKLYRDYLVRKGVLTELKQSENTDIPLYLETLGALETTKQVLGVPVTTMVALTTFKDNIEMLDKLKNVSKINNIKLKLTGWANGGMFPTVPNGVDAEKVLGGEKDFKELIKYASENGFTVYPDFDLAYAYNDESFDGFKPAKDLAQTIDEKPTVKKIYNPITQTFERAIGIGIISPTVMDRFYTNTYKDYSSYNVGAIALSTLGNTLSSDFNPDDTLHREDSKTLVTKLLAKVKENNGKLLISGGNEYALPYATDVIDVPLDDSSYKYSSASVPFMSMVLHGYIDYAGTAINLAGDYRYALLKTIESGASPYFVVAQNNTAELKKYSTTMLSKYYSIRYNIWIEDIISTYHELNNSLKDVRYSKVESHQFLDKNNKVVKVTYDNGTSFYINYLLTDYTAVDSNGNDLVIPAEGFVKVDKSGNKIS